MILSTHTKVEARIDTEINNKYIATDMSMYVCRITSARIKQRNAGKKSNSLVSLESESNIIFKNA